MLRISSSLLTLTLSCVLLPSCQRASQPEVRTSPGVTGVAGNADNIDRSTETMVLKVHGMSCPLCATNVDKQLLKVDGVESVQVNLNTGDVTLQVSRQSPPDEAALVKAVEESGFTLAQPPHRP